MDEPAFHVVDADSRGVRRALDRYFAELADRFPEGFDRTAALETTRTPTLTTGSVRN